MEIKFHKWEFVSGRRYQPVLRLWDDAAECYVSEPGYLDCFDSAEAAALAASMLSATDALDYRAESAEAFGSKKVRGLLSPDPIRGGPFRDRAEAERAAAECCWDAQSRQFVVDPDTLAHLSLIQQVISVQAQTELAEFVGRYMYQENGKTKFRQVRGITMKSLQLGNPAFYSKRPGRPKTPSHPRLALHV